MLNINNTATDWHKFLASLADEAARDADATAPEFALHGVLHDLSLVARAYASRLDVERGREGANELKQSAPVSDDQLVTDRVSAEPSAEPVSPSVLPGWLLETLATMGKEIEELRRRVEYLENNQQKSVVTPSMPYALNEAEIYDEDRSAWNTVDRARAALRGMLAREHQQRARIRQTVLLRVTALANQPGDLTADEKAELRQHQVRAEELAQIDAICGVKLDEIAGTDDLLMLREFDVKKGWPE